MAKNLLQSFLQRLRTAALLRDGGGQTDAQLLRRFIEWRDETAFEALVRLHGAMVLGVCQRLLHSVQDAEDAFQATFLVLVRKAGSLSKRDLVGNWLYGVARRTALKTRALSLKRGRKEQQVAVLPEPKSRETHALWEEVKPHLDAALELLPRKYRTVVILCDLENKSQQEAARQIGCPVGTVSSRLARGRALLAKQLVRRGVTLTSAALVAGLAQHAAAAWVPPKLVLTTVQAATLWAAEGTAAGVVSIHVAALTQGVLKAMFLTKLKAAALMLLALGTIGVGAGSLLSQVDDDTSGRKAATAPQDASDEIDGLAFQEGARPRVDLHGDSLPPGAITRLGTTRFSSYGGRHVAYSSDGAHIVVANSDEAIVYEAATGKDLRRIRPVGNSGIDSMSLSADGKLIALGAASHEGNGPASLQVFDVATGNFLREYKDAVRQQYLRVRFSPDGKVVAAYLSQSKTICLWNVATGRELRRWPLTSLSACFAFSPDGKTLIAGDRWMIRFWEVATGVETRRIDKHPGILYSLTLSPDGKTLASQAEAFQTEVYLWDVPTGKKLCDIESVAPTGQFEFSPNGKALVTSDGDGVLGTWDAATGKWLQRWETSAAHFAFAPDGKTVALLGPSKFIRFLDLSTGQETREHSGHRHGVHSLALSHDGHMLASASFGDIYENGRDVRLWNVATGKEELRIRPGVNSERGLFFSVDDRVLITLSDANNVKEFVTKLRFWDVGSGKELRQIQAPVEGEAWRGHHAKSPDGKTIATVFEFEGGKADKIILWDAATGKKVQELTRDRAWFRALGFSPDNRSVYSWSLEGKVLVWDAATGKLAREFPVKSPAGAAKDHWWGNFSPDGKWFVCGGEAGDFLLYGMAAGKEARRVTIRENNPSLAFSPDERTLAVGAEDGTIHLLELATGNLRHHITGGHQAAVSALVFAADGKRLVSGSQDTTALVWDLTGRLNGKREPLSSTELDACWTDLKSDDATRAYQAMRRLGNVSAQAVPLLNKRLEPVAAPDRKRLTNLIADLDSDLFAKRQAATKELTDLGEMAEPALREALDKAPSPEARLRMQQILAKLENIGGSGEPLRQARAVETLERIGTSQALQVLERLAAGISHAHLTRDAKTTLNRLRQTNR